MSLSRHHLKHIAAVARYQAGHSKPPTRKQARTWLDPLRKAFNEIRTGEVDAHRGYPITRINWADNDFARIDFAINGFLALTDRVMPELDTSLFKRISAKLASGVLMQSSEIDQCFILLNACEDKLVKIPREVLKDAANIEMVAIEMERLGLKDAA